MTSQADKNQARNKINARQKRLEAQYGASLAKAVAALTNDPRIAKYLFGDEEITFEKASDPALIKKMADLVQAFNTAIDPASFDPSNAYESMLN